MDPDQVSQLKSDVDNVRAVETFLYALQDEDYDTADRLLADHIVWQNVVFPTIRGRERIIGLMRRGEGRMGFEVKIHRIAAEGNAVLTERTDAVVFGPLRVQFWVCGAFEVHAGRITLWRTTSTCSTSSRRPSAASRRRCSPRCARRCSGTVARSGGQEQPPHRGQGTS